MNRIHCDKKCEAFDYWEHTLDENVVLLSVSDDFRYTVKATVEIDENEYPNTGLRVIAYANGTGWELDDEALADVYSVGLIDAITELQGRHCGDMYFYYEREGEERSSYETAFDCMCCFAENDSPAILDVTNKEFRQIFDILKPGDYLIHISWDEVDI
jgi:hypothetical protein